MSSLTYATVAPTTFYHHDTKNSDVSHVLTLSPLLVPFTSEYISSSSISPHLVTSVSQNPHVTQSTAVAENISRTQHISATQDTSVTQSTTVDVNISATQSISAIQSASAIQTISMMQRTFVTQSTGMSGKISAALPAIQSTSVNEGIFVIQSTVVSGNTATTEGLSAIQSTYVTQNTAMSGNISVTQSTFVAGNTSVTQSISAIQKIFSLSKINIPTPILSTTLPSMETTTFLRTLSSSITTSKPINIPTQLSSISIVAYEYKLLMPLHVPTNTNENAISFKRTMQGDLEDLYILGEGARRRRGLSSVDVFVSSSLFI